MDAKGKMLVEKWKPIIEVETAKEVAPEYKEIIATLLENQERFINEGAMDQSGEIAQFAKVLIPAVRRIFPGLIANEIVGVQPLSGPTGYAYALRYFYGNDQTNAVANLASVDRGVNGAPKWQSLGVVFNTAYTPTAGDQIKTNDTAATLVGTVVYAEENKALVNLADPATPITVGTQYKVGSDVVTATFVIQNEAGYNLIFRNYSGPYDTATGETLGTKMKTMKMSMERVSVEAMTRKLKAEYSLEFAEDLKAMHGLNAEKELINVMEYEITAEIDRELLNLINSKAMHTSDWSYQNAPGSQGRWEMEKLRTLYTKIRKEANQIAITTRRGAGNFIVGSVNVVTALQNLSGFMYAGVPGDLKMGMGIMKVGTLDGQFTVYADTFATGDYVTVGYKGPSNMDAGVIYCPYIPLQLIKVIDPETFQPKLGFKTRYGTVDNLYGTENYYRRFAVDFTGSSIQ